MYLWQATFHLWRTALTKNCPPAAPRQACQYHTFRITKPHQCCLFLSVLLPMANTFHCKLTFYPITSFFGWYCCCFLAQHCYFQRTKELQSPATSIHPSIHPSIYPSIHLSVYLPAPRTKAALLVFLCMCSLGRVWSIYNLANVWWVCEYLQFGWIEKRLWCPTSI